MTVPVTVQVASLPCTIVLTVVGPTASVSSFRWHGATAVTVGQSATAFLDVYDQAHQLMAGVGVQQIVVSDPSRLAVSQTTLPSGVTASLAFALAGSGVKPGSSATVDLTVTV